MANKYRISENPSNKRISSILPIAKFLNSTSSLLINLKIKSNFLMKTKKSTDYLLSEPDLVTLPDQFNENFSEKGWIATDSFSVTVMRQAIKLYEDSNQSAAEAAIIDWFSEDIIKFCSPSKPIGPKYSIE